MSELRLEYIDVDQLTALIEADGPKLDELLASFRMDSEPFPTMFDELAELLRKSDPQPAEGHL